MTLQTKLRFPAMCRDLRLEKNLKQREVADMIGVAHTTYGNVESNNHKTIALSRVRQLARVYQLPPDRAAEFEAAWEALPASDYSERQAKTFDERRALRGKAKRAAELEVALVEILGVLVGAAADPETLCACTFESERPCEICGALALLGLKPWTNSETVIADLAALQEKQQTAES